MIRIGFQLALFLAITSSASDRLLQALPFWPDQIDVLELIVASVPAPVPETGQTTSFSLGDDGDIRPGTPWPNPRFVDNGDGTVTDRLSGLVWLQNAHCFGNGNWDSALNWAQALQSGDCGLTDGSTMGDWSVPTSNELASLIDYQFTLPALSNDAGTGQWVPGESFTNVDMGWTYWTSTTFPGGTIQTWWVSFSIGKVSRLNTLTKSLWPVRRDTTLRSSRSDLAGSAPIIAPSPVARTGRVTSWRPTDDGALQPGVEWPVPRFTINANGTVTDNLTHLVWLRDANCFGGSTWQDALNAANSLGSGQCGLTDGSQAGDWHLPSLFELRSLIYHEETLLMVPNTAGTAKWSTDDPFMNLSSTKFWSSTTKIDDPNRALNLSYIDASMDDNDKTDTFLLTWPVKGGL